MNFLLINQTFYPDVNATGQYLTDLAVDLKKGGHEVTVLTGNHGYDDPSQTYPPQEVYQGIRILRIGYTRFGKKYKVGRFLNFASFLLNLFFHLLCLGRQDRVVALTSPPLIALLGAVHCRLKGGRLVQWVMDLNPDEAIAAGWLSERSLSARFLKSVARWTFGRCDGIIALDRFMKARLVERYGVPEAKISVIPPWAHDAELKPIDPKKNPFREKYSLEGKFVVMYSGNHSPCHPLDTVLEAALTLKEDPTVLFYFVGGGSLVEKVKEFTATHGLRNVVQLPYQPLEKLSESLSAGDLHLVVMGDAFVGIVHPCKIYGVLAVGKPFVFIGPKESHMNDLMRESGVGAPLRHGDASGLVDVIQQTRSMSESALRSIAERELSLKERRFGRNRLSAEMIRVIENVK